MRALLKKIRRTLLSGTLIEHYFKSKHFRVSISLLLSLAMNIIYLIFNVVSGVKYGSMAFISVAIYYALHICIRYIILKRSHENIEKKEECIASKRAGILLLLADTLISPMLIFGGFSVHSTSYSAIVIAFLGIYAICTLINASIGLFSSRVSKIPLRKAAYCVKLASGVVSIFNLLCALMANFVDDEFVLETFTVMLGVAVSFSVLCLSLALILSAVKTERSL